VSAQGHVQHGGHVNAGGRVTRKGHREPVKLSRSQNDSPRDPKPKKDTPQKTGASKTKSGGASAFMEKDQGVRGPRGQAERSQNRRPAREKKRGGRSYSEGVEYQKKRWNMVLTQKWENLKTIESGKQKLLKRKTSKAAV